MKKEFLRLKAEHMQLEANREQLAIMWNELFAELEQQKAQASQLEEQVGIYQKCHLKTLSCRT